MINKPDGGPAFPVIYSYERGDGAIVSQYHDGMTLRDWFAGQALMGMFAHAQPSAMLTGAYYNNIAQACYAGADAMLKERSKP